MDDRISNPIRDSKPPLTVILGPGGAGKTSACLERFRSSESAARILLPSEQEAMRIRSLLDEPAAREGSPVCSFVEFVIALAGGKRVRQEVIRGTTRSAVLLDIAARHCGAESYFGRMRGMRGFANVLGEAIRELKLTAITPEQLGASSAEAAAATDDPDLDRKSAEIATLFRSWQDFLRDNNLVDEEDLVVRAAESVRLRAPELSLILLDGFYRLSRIWRLLLADLARARVEIVVTLPFDHGRPLLFAAPLRTLESLRSEFAVREIHLSPASSGRARALASMERGLFAPKDGEEADKRAHSPTVEPPHSILIHDAPNPYTEVEMAARAVRREHQEAGTPWNRCSVILRSAGDYTPILESVFERYEIPISILQPRRVADSPAVQTLSALCRIVMSGWQRQDVIGFLKSGLTPGNRMGAESLLRQARRLGVLAGREEWMGVAVETTEPEPLMELLRRLAELDSLLNDRDLHSAEIADALLKGIESFEVGSSCRGGESSMPYDAANGIIRDIGRAGSLIGREFTPPASFWNDVESVLNSAVYTPRPDPSAVWALDAYDSRLRACSFAVILGLVERGFPQRITEDPFFRDDERAALARFGIPLEPRAERADDERLLFYLAVTAPTERLILSFPRSSDDSDALPSFYLDEAREAVGEIHAVVRTLADVAPRADECVTESDSLLAQCAAVTDAASNATRRETWKERLDSALELTGSESDVRRIAATSSLPPLPAIRSPENRTAYSGHRRYHVSEIETYNTCPFQHLMKYGLRIRSEQDGAGPADRGRLYHAVLRNHFRGHAGIATDMKDLRLNLLEELERCLEEFAVDARPHRRRLLERFLREALTGFAEREAMYAEKFGLSPTHFEISFGMSEDESRNRDHDKLSTSQPLVLHARDGHAIHLCGVIDRIDSEGATAMVIDYKTGASRTYDQVKSGDSLQMPLYLMAVEAIWEMDGAAACYDSAREPFRRRFFRSDHLQRFGLMAGVESGREIVKPVSAGEFAETRETAVLRVIQAVDGITACEVLPKPGPACRSCDYSDCCRTDLACIHDGEPFDLLAEEAPPLMGMSGSEVGGERGS